MVLKRETFFREAGAPCQFGNLGKQNRQYPLGRSSGQRNTSLRLPTVD